MEKEMYGATMTRGEKEEMDKRSAMDRASKASESMREMFGSTMTNREKKAMKRESRKGKR